MSKTNVNSFLTNRPSFQAWKVQQKDNFNSFMSELRYEEENRQDHLLRMKDVKPLDLSKDGNWIVEDEKGNAYTLTHQSISQLGAKRHRAAFSQAYAYSSPLLMDAYDINGNPIKINFRDVAFREAMASVPQKQVYFREVSDISDLDTKYVKGIVGRNYPIGFKDSRLIDALQQKSEELGLKPQIGHYFVDQGGNLQVEMMYENEDYTIFQKRDGREIKEQMGFAFRNSSFGDEAMWGGTYMLTLECLNGLTTWHGRYSFRVTHASTKSFINNIINNLIKYQKEKEYADFSRNFGIEINVRDNWESYKDFEALYEPTALGMIFRTIQGSHYYKTKYEQAASLRVKDWNREVLERQKSLQLTDAQITTMKEIAEFDPTLRLSSQEASMYDISAIMTSAANAIGGDGAKKLQEAAATILISKPRTPMVKN